MDWLGVLKSSRVQHGIAAIAFVFLGPRLGLTEEQIFMVVATVCTIIVGRSIRPPAE